MLDLSEIADRCNLLVWQVVQLIVRHPLPISRWYNAKNWFETLRACPEDFINLLEAEERKVADVRAAANQLGTNSGVIKELIQMGLLEKQQPEERRIGHSHHAVYLISLERFKEQYASAECALSGRK